jgi:putative endonuclease
MIAAYILKCGDGTYYAGSARDLETRCAQHAAGKGSAYTSKRLPVELVWIMECETVAAAYAVEKRIQGWSRAKREALIAGRADLLPALSKKDFTQRTPDA